MNKLPLPAELAETIHRFLDQGGVLYLRCGTQSTLDRGRRFEAGAFTRVRRRVFNRVTHFSARDLIASEPLLSLAKLWGEAIATHPPIGHSAAEALHRPLRVDLLKLVPLATMGTLSTMLEACETFALGVVEVDVKIHSPSFGEDPAARPDRLFPYNHTIDWVWASDNESGESIARLSSKLPYAADWLEERSNPWADVFRAVHDQAEQAHGCKLVYSHTPDRFAASLRAPAKPWEWPGANE